MDKPCYKCKSNSATFKLRSNLVCTGCFILNIEHLFRSTFKRLLLPRREDILVCVSGGPNASSLLHLVESCKDSARTSRIMQFNTHVLYIDDSLIYNTPQEATAEFIDFIQNKYSVTVNVISLQDEVPDIQEKLNTCPQNRADILFLTIHEVLRKWVVRNGFKKVVTGESASRISSIALAEICKGRGSQVFELTQATLTVEDSVIARPMREILDKEIAIYQKIQGLAVLPKLPLSNITTLPNAGSINILTEEFIHKLQSKFPSTTHTLLRTAAKLIAPSLGSPPCGICNKPIDRPLSLLEEFKNQQNDICYACHHLV